MPRKPFVLLLALVVLATTGAAASRGRSEAPAKASAYINPDTGASTENPDVDPDSRCRYADRTDTQQLSLPMMSDKNVHIDACLFKGGKKFDAPATWRSKGAGTISACPDPDMVGPLDNGPKVAYTDEFHGTLHCHQSGYQQKGIAGDKEFHVRVNNSADPGVQTIVFCYDPDQAGSPEENQPEGHGCRDETVKSRVVITWIE
ncbi:MAG: hypothetical protein M3280_13590 [Actinomycetota bacterium]|nr:hypothetical protein [Actinomycetota bacterium]